MSIFQKIIHRVLVIAVTLAAVSCEYDSDDENYHEVERLPDEIQIGINLANTMPDDIIYIYGSTALYYEAVTEVGVIRSLTFTLDGETHQAKDSKGYFYISPEDNDNGIVKTLQLDLIIKGNNNSLADQMLDASYASSLQYKVKYVKIVPQDFALKKAEVDKMTFAMVNKNDSPCRYVMDGKEIADLDNIEILRENYGHFPYGVNTKIYLVPKNVSISYYESCNYVDLWLYDSKFENYPLSCSNFMVDKVNKKLYSPYLGIYTYDENMKFEGKKAINDFSYMQVTPTGLLACYSYGKIITYADNSFSQVVSTIDNAFSSFSVTEKEQLFWVNNYQVDAFNLRTGELIYSIQKDPYSYVSSMCVSDDGKYMYVQFGDNAYIYQLTDNSATLSYTLDKFGRKCHFHPVNKYHLILEEVRDGFEIYDVESRQTVFSDRGELQSIDPITGNMLYYDEAYSYEDGQSKNIFVDKNYQQIYVLNNDTRGLCGPFLLFNNYLIKSTNYVDISSKLSEQ